MGTDIHGIFQRYEPDSKTWVDIPSSYEEGRDYQLFAVLAGVRNGRGFAGIQIGEAVTPIAEPRGLPKDFAMKDDCHPLASLNLLLPRRRKYYQKDESPSQWMGYHDFSWLTGQEMLEWYANAPEVVKIGILTRAVYESWDGRHAPSSYCGGVSGPGIVLINDSEIEKAKHPDWTDIRCTWESELKEELAYFFEEVQRQVNLHGKVRFVFGFDS